MSKEAIKVTTPKGELHWVNISGQGKENYNQDGYNYVATIHLAGEAAEGLKAKIDEVLGEVPKGKTIKSTGYRKVYKDSDGKLFSPTKVRTIRTEAGTDEDGNAYGPDEETDIMAFTFTTRTTYGDGKPKEVKVYNKDAKRVNLGDRKVGNGSEGCISGKMERFERGKEVGVSLFLNAIQLTKFTEYAEDAGFDQQDGEFDGVSDEETGFTGETDTETAAPAKEKPKPRI